MRLDGKILNLRGDNQGHANSSADQCNVRKKDPIYPQARARSLRVSERGICNDSAARRVMEPERVAHFFSSISWPFCPITR